MMQKLRCTGRVIAVLAAVAATALAAPKPESAKGVTELLQRLIPLPKEISIKQQVTLPAAAVRIALRRDAGELEQNAARKLRQLFLNKAGVDASAGGEFEILLGVCDAQGRIGDVTVPDAARLKKLPNREQAYLIRPVGADKLALAALDERGVFYAAVTLCQLLESRFHRDDVTIPLATITDWPDMAERGEWGCSSTRDIEWMAERKMNLVEFHTVHRVSKDGKAETSISESLLRRGKLNAVKMVPIISHLNGMGRRGVYDAYPELKGKGKRAVYKGHGTVLYSPCASNPKLHEIIADWMRGYASYGVHDICCWLGELRQRCECEECSKVGQFALEARAFVKAWQLARKDFPDLRIRILLTQGSYDTNDKVLAEVPPEVGVTYYDGGKTYDSSKDPMIYPLLEKYAAEGHWLGCYPQLTPSWRIVSPWSCPQFVKFRMTEFVDKKLSCLGGYVVPDNRLFDFNVTAAAEWSWNAHGRDEREFALAWATRKGFANPDIIADWAVKLGPASWDIYGARLVERYFFRPKSIESILAARAKPAFGKGMFRYIPDRDHLQRNLKTCRAALHLARQAGSPAILAESQAVLGYYDMLDQLCRMCDLLAEHGILDANQRQTLQRHMNRFALAGALNIDALRDWERSVQVGAGLGRFREGVQATADTIEAAARALEPLGIRNPTPYIGAKKIGGWELKDFRETATIVKTFDVTKAVIGPGTYEVTFQYTSGWNGLGTRRVALTTLPKSGQGKPVEVCVDEHPGSTGCRSKGNIYSLTLKEYSPDVRYLIVANVRGTRPQDQQPGRTGCSGLVYLRRERDPDWQIQVMGIQPLMAGAEGATRKTRFSGKGIRVGVVGGGYGSDGLLELLQKSDGIDALSIGLGALRGDECQVIVLPQFRSAMVPDALAKEIEGFVRRGGGLITTHDAVGYRAMPVVCADICAGGAQHVRYERWKVAADHPVTAGLPRNKVLTQGYYDHIQLKPGPKGTVVAVSEKTGKPVVIVGTLGKGRYVACGLLPGFSADNQEVTPTPDEGTLLLNAIRWCGRGAEK
ncbi:MAG: hypothetical protein GXP25_02270 [Planctomycetes bacterium]|nr:hypothetical protein [Planctomycetota bacterium]